MLGTYRLLATVRHSDFQAGLELCQAAFGLMRSNRCKLERTLVSLYRHALHGSWSCVASMPAMQFWTQVLLRQYKDVQCSQCWRGVFAKRNQGVLRGAWHQASAGCAVSTFMPQLVLLMHSTVLSHGAIADFKLPVQQP